MYDLFKSSSIPTSVNGITGNLQIVGSGTVRVWPDGSTVQISEALPSGGALGVVSLNSALGPIINLAGHQGVDVVKIDDNNIDINLDLSPSGFLTNLNSQNLPSALITAGAGINVNTSVQTGVTVIQIVADLTASGFTTLPAVQADLRASGYATLTDVRNDIRASGYATLGDVRTDMRASGYTTLVEVQASIHQSGYATVSQIRTSGYTTLTEVRSDIRASGYATLADVRNDLRPSGYTTIGEVHTDIGASGYQRLPTVYPIATDYTVKVSDRVLLVNASLAPRVITLPSAALASGITWNIKKVDNTINTVTVSGVELIDGSLTQIISLQYNNLTVIGDGSQYWIL